MMGMVHAAMFDAVNSIEPRYRPYLVQLPADRRDVEGSRCRGGSRQRSWRQLMQRRRVK